MAQGHILDGNTVALWRMDDQGQDTKILIRDKAPGARHFSAVSEGAAAPTRPGGPNSELCRQFTAASSVNRPGDAASQTLCLGSLTLEAMIRHDLSATGMFLIYAGTGESLATNIILQWYMGTNGAQHYLWESGAGVDTNYSQNVLPMASADAWTHVAVTKTTGTLKFYVDGVLAQTIATSGAPAGGTSASWYLGGTSSNTLPYVGWMSGLKVTARVKSDAELAAASAAWHASFSPPLDGDEFACWEMADSADAVIDSSPNKIHLWPRTTANLLDRNAPLIEDGGHSIFINSIDLYSYTAAASGHGVYTEILRQALQGPFTFECWMMLATTQSQAANRGIFRFGIPGTESAATNFLSVDLTANGYLQWFNEYGSGPDSTAQTPSITTAGYTMNVGQRLHLGVRRNAVIAPATTHTVDFFLDGAFFAQITGIEPFTGGTSQHFQLGRGVNETAFHGAMDDVRFSDIARTDEEILESYQRGAGIAPDDGSPFTYRMRGMLGGDWVYWNAPLIDAAADEYPGVGTPTDIVVVDVKLAE